ncbi:hypothetical protein BDN70DRAFT_147294 [Pholiota conissans]|uniref:Uncharacterized protein n=1 Tax=Pholiota conissans TaxID=109636 RepID=A0A9P6CS37_9AGAR|nr:hypothetical protein BDN70DRAFT_147294 [Pholiota conissans]
MNYGDRINFAVILIILEFQLNYILACQAIISAKVSKIQNSAPCNTTFGFNRICSASPPPCAVSWSPRPTVQTTCSFCGILRFAPYSLSPGWKSSSFSMKSESKGSPESASMHSSSPATPAAVYLFRRSA